MTAYLCDANVWLALALSKHSHHRVSSDWFETIEGAGSVLFCRSTQQTFLRLLTNPAVLGAYGNKPLTNSNAWAVYEQLKGDDRVGLLTQEPTGVETAWTDFALRKAASPKLWMDAYLAAFAYAGGYRMVTTDRAYKQFARLDLVLLRA